MSKTETAILDPRADPKVGQMRKRVEEMIRQSTSVPITNQRTYDRAVAERAGLKTLMENIDELFEPMRVNAYAAYKSVLSTKASLHDPVEQGIKLRTQDILEWEDKKEEERQAEQTRLEEEALRKAEKARKGQITKAKNRGDKETAERLEDAPLDVAPVEVDDTYKKSDAISRRTTYRGEVVDLYELVKFVAKDKHFIHLLEANMREVNRLANSQQARLSVPGLKAVPNKSLASVNRRDDD